MKNNILNTIILIGIFFLISSCDKTENESSLESIDFGESIYFDPFLWSKSDTTVLKRTLKFEFSDYAVEQHAQLELQFTDDKQNILNNNQHVNIFVDNSFVRNGKIKIEAKSNIVTKTIGFQFLPGSDLGEHHGFLIISSHNFDRIDNFSKAQIGSDNRIKRWSAKYDKEYNHLAFGVFWLLIILLIFIFIWFFIFRNQFYPKMKKGRIQVQSPYFKSIPTKGVRMIIFSREPRKQGYWDRLWKGKILYEINTIWDKDVIITPKRKNLKIKLPPGFIIKPVTLTLTKYNTYEIKTEKQTIKLQYN